jgi:hypothetical protein
MATTMDNAKERMQGLIAEDATGREGNLPTVRTRPVPKPTDTVVDKLGWLMDIAAESDLIIGIAHRYTSAQQILVEKNDFMAENRMNVVRHNR